VYDKSRILFGLHLARKSISERGVALLVEGQFDVMMAHQNGIDYAIASSGTAVTPEQVKLLRRYATDLLLCLDCDEAGRHATQRAIEMASRAGLRVKVAELPNAKDPGEFFEKTPQLWDQVEGAALAGWEWWIKGVLEENNTRTADGRARAAKALVAILSRIPEEATLDIYCQYAAERLRLDPATLLVDVQRYRKTGALPKLETAEVDAAAVLAHNGNGATRTAPEEDRLLGLILANRNAWAILQDLLAGEPFTGELQELYLRLVEVDASGSNLERHLERFSPDERTRLVRLSLTTATLVEEHELHAALADCVDRIRLKRYETEMAALEDQLRDLGAEQEDVRESLLQEIHRIAKRRVELKTRLYQGQT
jgi:DNA primase